MIIMKGTSLTSEWRKPFDFNLLGWNKSTATLLSRGFSDEGDCIFGRLPQAVERTGA